MPQKRFTVVEHLGFGVAGIDRERRRTENRVDGAFCSSATMSSIRAGQSTYPAIQFSGATSVQHFYTPSPTEYAIVTGNSDWTYKGDVFSVPVPDGSITCPASTARVNPINNNRLGCATNHRYTTDFMYAR
jgi:hypothetical protein